MAVVGLPFWKAGYWTDDFWAAGFWVATPIAPATPRQEWVQASGVWILTTVYVADEGIAERWIEDPDKNWQLRTV